MERFWSKVDTTPGQGPLGECWEWQAQRDHQGYGRFKLDGKSRKASRVAYELTKGPVPRGQVVKHSCDNPPCCNPAHLDAGTVGENAQEAYDRGRMTPPSGPSPEQQVRGERHGSAKVTSEVVTQMRSDYQTGVRQAELVRRTGLSRAQVSRIVNGLNWSEEN